MEIDSAASHRTRILAMRTDVFQTGPGANPHNYVVLGGSTGEWGIATLKRFTRVNLYARNFELF
jgi:hypothetical protein